MTTSGAYADAVFAQSVGGGGGLAGFPTSATSPVGSLAGFAGSSGGAGNSGAVSVTVSGQVMTTGANADGVFAQSAAGSGSGGAVSITVSGQIIAEGLASSAIQAESLGKAGQGAETVKILDGGMAVAGDGGYGVLFGGGASASLNNAGTINSTFGYAVASDGAPIAISNSGYIGGSVTSPGKVSFTNDAGAVFAPGASVALGPGGFLINAGTVSPFGVGTVGVTNLTGRYVQTSTGVLEIDLDLGLNTADVLAISGGAVMAGSILVNPIDAATVKPGDYITKFLTVSGALNHTGLTIEETSAVVDLRLDFVGIHTIPNTPTVSIIRRTLLA